MTKLTSAQILSDTLEALKAVETALDAIAEYPRRQDDSDDARKIEKALEKLQADIADRWNSNLEPGEQPVYVCDWNTHGHPKCERWTTNQDEQGQHECDACQDYYESKQGRVA